MARTHQKPATKTCPWCGASYGMLNGMREITEAMTEVYQRHVSVCDKQPWRVDDV